MSTTPIPSTLVEDFRLNVEDFDAFSNGVVSYTDRFGLSRLSLSQFMESIGYEVPVAFASGLSITRVTQTVTNAGNTYHARATEIPFTTTVTFNAAQWDLIVSTPVEVATHTAALKTVPVSLDEFPLIDSAASFALKRITWANIVAGIYAGGTYTGAYNGKQGTDIASAATTNIGAATGNSVNVTGVVTITSLGTPAQAGIKRTVTFTGSLILTHNATTLILPSAANVRTQVGDVAEFISTAIGWRCTMYRRASGAGGVVDGTKGADIASAATTDIGAATGDYVVVTGTTTITALGTAPAGEYREVRFGGALTLTHNATTLILPNNTNVLTVAGDVARFRSEGSGNWRCTNYTRADGSAINAVLTKSYVSAQQTITTAGALTLAHSLGAIPKIISSELVCLTAEAGYSIGDVVEWVFSDEASGSTRGVSIVKDATNLTIRYSSLTNVFSVLNKTTGSAANLTNTNWQFVVRAYA